MLLGAKKTFMEMVTKKTVSQMSRNKLHEAAAGIFLLFMEQ